MTATMSSAQSAQQALYTCISCLVGFHSPVDQRAHYRSDLHRYNMKRQVAGLPPVRQEIYEQKVQQSDTSMIRDAPRDENNAGQRSKCRECMKGFASRNALASHLNSRKHKETVAKMTKTPAPTPLSDPAVAAVSEGPLVFQTHAGSTANLESSHRSGVADAPLSGSKPVGYPLSTSEHDLLHTECDTAVAGPSSFSNPSLSAPASLVLAHDASDADVEAAITDRLMSAARINPSKQCIFCGSGDFTSVETSLDHMQIRHGFFIPEKSYLIDLSGLVQYLADKVAVGHMCLYCNGRGRTFSTAQAAQKHMLDKSHCKIAYEREEDRLELSDYYDFTSSYPDYQSEAEWEDMEMSGSGDEDSEDQREQVSGVDIDARNDGLRYGDSELELILPSGARLGHRSLARYYRQSLFSTPASLDRIGGGAVARRLIEQGREPVGPGSALIVKDRNGGQVKARNRGEAREAKRHISEFRDSQKREQFKTRVGFVHNSQKHFRDPLLQ